MLISPLGEKSPLITSGKVLMFLHLLKYRGGFFCFLISMTIILLQIGFMTVKLLQIDRERPLEIDHIYRKLCSVFVRFYSLVKTHFLSVKQRRPLITSNCQVAIFMA